VAEALRAEGVKYVFGIPGGQSCDILYDGLYDTPDVKPILVRHEEAGVFMAYAYARLTGEPGVCTGTVGPGAQHLVSGIAEAWSGCIPIVAIAPQVSTEIEGLGALQDFPQQTAMFAPFTKWSVRIPRTDRIAWYMRRAFQTATTGKPGPVFVEIPADVGTRKIEMPAYVRSIRPLRVRPSKEQVKEAGALIIKAERPVIVAGGGVYLSGAFEELKNFAEMLAIPVLASAGGKGSIPEDHPLSAGCLGLYRTEVGKKVWDDADLVIGVGTRFEEMESAGWHWLPKNAKLIQIDVDPTEIARNWIPAASVIGDAKLALEDLIEYLSDRIKKMSYQEYPRVRELIKAKKEFEDALEGELAKEGKVTKVLQIMKEARKVFDKDAILVHENGATDVWSYSYFPVLSAGMDVIPAGQTCMGFGVAAVIGAKLALPEKQAVCVTGDGAFQMMMDNLSVAKQYKAAATWIILNNSSLGWIKYIEHLAYKNRYIGADFEAQPDFAKIAEAHGCFGERIERSQDVKAALENAVEANKENVPAVLDFVVGPFDFYPAFIDFHKPLAVMNPIGIDKTSQ
jgi:acetolactate synthase-1/2/3 large subunit